MAMNSIGDLAQSHSLRLHNARLNSEMTTLVQELTSGKKADMAKAVSGNFAPIAGIEHSIKQLEALESSTAEVAGLVGAAQVSLENIQGLANDLSSALITAGDAGQSSLALVTGNDAQSKFASAVGFLNTRFADRSVFGGKDTSTSPMASAETILADLNTAIAGETTASGIKAVVDAWFGAGGAYETVAYQGSGSQLSDLPVGRNQSVSLPVTGDDMRLRDVLKGLAMATLVQAPALSGQADEQIALAKYAGETLLTSDNGMVNLRAEVGTVEATIEDNSVANAAELSGLEIARNSILEIDPYEVASQLEYVQAQLETLYALTARSANMSLVNYLR